MYTTLLTITTGTDTSAYTLIPKKNRQWKWRASGLAVCQMPMIIDHPTQHRSMCHLIKDTQMNWIKVVHRLVIKQRIWLNNFPRKKWFYIASHLLDWFSLRQLSCDPAFGVENRFHACAQFYGTIGNLHFTFRNKFQTFDGSLCVYVHCTGAQQILNWFTRNLPHYLHIYTM